VCIDRRAMPRKARIFLAIGNVCLFTGVAMTTVNHRFGALHADWFDFFRGMLMGMAITFMFFAARLSCRRPPQPLSR